MASLSPEPLTIVEVSLLTVTFSARPNISTVAPSSFNPFSSEITTPPVSTAISSSISLRRSPKPGAFTAHTLREPRRRFTTKVAKASLSTSSAMINKGRPDCAVASRIGSISLSEEIFLSKIRMYGFSISHSIFSVLVTKYGEM